MVPKVINSDSTVNNLVVVSNSSMANNNMEDSSSSSMEQVRIRDMDKIKAAAPTTDSKEVLNKTTNTSNLSNN